MEPRHRFASVNFYWPTHNGGRKPDSRLEMCPFSRAHVTKKRLHSARYSSGFSDANDQKNMFTILWNDSPFDDDVIVNIKSVLDGLLRLLMNVG